MCGSKIRVFRPYRGTIAICGLLLAISLAMAAKPSPTLQLLLMVAAPAWAIAALRALVFLFRQVWDQGARAAVPLVACIGTIVLTLQLAPVANRLYFELKRPAFDVVIADRQSRKMENGMSQIIPSDVAYCVLVERTSAGRFQIEFLTGGGFPVKHTGFVYAETGSVDPGSRIGGRWRRWNRLDQNWFAIAD